jgi:hypothetical protein
VTSRLCGTKLFLDIYFFSLNYQCRRFSLNDIRTSWYPDILAVFFVVMTIVPSWDIPSHGVLFCAVQAGTTRAIYDRTLVASICANSSGIASHTKQVCLFSGDLHRLQATGGTIRYLTLSWGGCGGGYGTAIYMTTEERRAVSCYCEDRDTVERLFACAVPM